MCIMFGKSMLIDHIELVVSLLQSAFLLILLYAVFSTHTIFLHLLSFIVNLLVSEKAQRSLNRFKQ